MSIGPVIRGENIHVTAFEKNGVFNSHLTYSDKAGKTKYENIATFTQEQMLKYLTDYGVDSISVMFEKYHENDEALVLTDEGQKLFREFLRGSLTINVAGRRLLFEIQFGNLIDKTRLLSDKVDRLFRVGKVEEALKRNLLGDRFVFTPDGRQIMKLGNDTYAFRKSLEEVTRDLMPSGKSVDYLFERLEKTGFGLGARYLELMGMKRLFKELEARDLFSRWLSN